MGRSSIQLHNTDPHLRDCIQLCWECRDTCHDTLFNHCLERGGEHVAQEHVRTMTDCIEVCQVAADFMRRNSHLHPFICQACADVCSACAKSCEHLSERNAIMKRCADACQRCAESCQKMAA